MSVPAPAQPSSHTSNGTHTPATGPPAAEQMLAAPPKLRRRPLLVAASAAAVVLGALLAVWAYTSTSNTQDVVAARNTVPRGQTITREDLMVAKIGVDPALDPVPAERLEALVGQRAAMDLAAGGLLTQQAVSDAVLPAKGAAIVGVSLASGMMPATELHNGDPVRLVSTPGAQGDPAAGEPHVIAATVVAVHPAGEQSHTVVDVSVPAPQAAVLAARAATGKVALVLDARER
jgi:hypothetical protein